MPEPSPTSRARPTFNLARLSTRPFITLLGVFVALCLPVFIQQFINWQNRISASQAERLACEHFLRLDPGWLTGEALEAAMSNDRLVLPTHFNSAFATAEDYLKTNMESQSTGSLRMFALPREIVTNISDTAMIGSQLQLDSALRHSETGAVVAFVDLPWPQTQPEVVKIDTPCGAVQQIFTLDLTAWDKGRLGVVSLQGQSVLGSQTMDVIRP